MQMWMRLLYSSTKIAMDAKEQNIFFRLHWHVTQMKKCSYSNIESLLYLEIVFLLLFIFLQFIIFELLCSLFQKEI